MTVIERKFVERVTDSLSQNIFLVKGSENNLAVWYYLLVEKNKIAIFNRLVAAHDANMVLENYGRILKAGWGKAPPQYIQQKVKAEGAGYNDAEFRTIADHPDMNYFVKGESPNGKRMYLYTTVPGEKAEEFMKVSKNGGCDVSAYGEIIKTGWGEPTRELMQEMEELGFTHENEYA